MSEGSPRIRLPIIGTCRLLNFSLYQDRPDVEVRFGEGVFCLAGANGLGKSTFLAALGFALTGVVADPAQKFASIDEYYTDSIGFSRDYFTGRIDTVDRSAASATLTFRVGDAEFTITRGMFEPTGLRHLTYFLPDVDERFSRDAESDDEKDELHKAYADAFVRATGLASFAQFVFVHHFLLSFDERRHLLFWDADVARQAIYLAFGVDAQEALQADDWLRQADRLESQARQAQYQATTALQRKKELSRRADGLEPLDESLVEEHGHLVEALDRCQSRLQEATRAAEDARLRHALAAAEHHTLLRDYQRLFDRQFSAGVDPAKHPIVQGVLDGRRCAICGTDSPATPHALQEAIHGGRCPLCATDLRESRVAPHDDAFDDLERLDAAITLADRRLQAAAADVSRTQSEVEAAEVEYRAAVEERGKFEARHEDLALTHETGVSALGPIIKQLEAERESAQDRRDKYRRRRDEYRDRLKPVQARAAQQYLDAAPVFVPRFQELAHAFLGLDLQVSMEQKARGVELLLTINGTRRRRTTQLSESQRYFVDIALRMALTEYMVGSGQPSTLYVDTPEGSLDVAYEFRAGRMFGAFVRSGHRLIMTANINSSNLIRRLAEVTGHRYMYILRMTDWAPLSEVQAEAEEAFDTAFGEFEHALARGSAT